MAGKKDAKLKLLYLKDILEKYSDEDNPLNASEIQAHLLKKGIDCERKSIYKDIEVLRDYGVDIQKSSPPKVGFYIYVREFDLPELRLLIDAVQSANFISKNKTKSMLEKMEKLSSLHQAKKLKKQVFIENRNKCKNEKLFYNIDILDNAIKDKKKVELTYTKRKLSEKYSVSNEKKVFKLSPYALIWSNDHYYLVANNEKYDNLMNMRIDRISNVSLLDEPTRQLSEVCEYKNSFDCADYTSKNFNMFSGKPEAVRLRCREEIFEEMLDRFGEKTTARKDDEGWFYITDDLYVNDGFISWVMQFGNKIEVIYPSEVREKIIEKSKSIIDLYSE